MLPWRPLPSKPPGKNGEATVTFRPLQPERPNGAGPLGAIPSLRNKLGCRATLGSPRFLPPEPTPSTSLYWAPLRVGSEPTLSILPFISPHMVAYEMKHVFSILLIRKLRQKLVTKFPPCHAAHKQWGWDQTIPRPLHVQLFPLHHEILHYRILSIPPLTLSNWALDGA